jgi:hypothetical protein
MSARLSGIVLKIERAKQHIADLEGRIESFRKSDSYRIVRDQHAQTDVFRFKIREQISAMVAVIIGEAIHHLRSALDHLIYQLVDANGNLVGDGGRLYFPCFETAPKKEAEFSGKIKGVAPRAEHMIRALQPYVSGDKTLAFLCKLDNINKHRLLFVTVFGFRNLKLRASGRAPRVSFKVGKVAYVWYGRPTDTPPAKVNSRFSELQDGDEILEIEWFDGRPSADFYENLNFTFDVAFVQPQIVNGKAVLPFLQELVKFVEGVVLIFKSFL